MGVHLESKIFWQCNVYFAIRNDGVELEQNNLNGKLDSFETSSTNKVESQQRTSTL